MRNSAINSPFVADLQNNFLLKSRGKKAMKLKQMFCLTVFLCLIIPATASALVVDIQGKILTPKHEGEACIDVSGEYQGFKIESSESGETAQVCFINAKQNTIDIHNINIVANNSKVKDAIISVEHSFPPGPNGLITVRTRAFGFFSTPTGTGVASGDTFTLNGFFSQNKFYDPVAKPFKHTVGNKVDSAIFETDGKEQYLIAGNRTLKAVLSFTLKGAGHKLTLPEGTSISLDTGARFEDKLDEMSVAKKN